MNRILMFAATAAAVLIASTGTAVAADQQFCVGAPSGAVSTPDSDGQCKRGTTLITLLTEQDVSALEARVSALETANSTLASKVSALESANNTLESKVSALGDKLSKVSYDETGLNGKPTLKISGANLQLADGSGDTFGATNGLGNLFIGYNERTGSREQTGSHNLVLGFYQSFTSSGSLLAGSYNTSTGGANVVFGSSNTASGENSSVSGGSSSTASGVYSSVSGGDYNTASGIHSSVSGGYGNTASGDWSSILGGYGVTVSANHGTSP